MGDFYKKDLFIAVPAIFSIIAFILIVIFLPPSELRSKVDGRNDNNKEPRDIDQSPSKRNGGGVCWCIQKIKTYFNKRRAAKQGESPQDRYSRRTANSTIAIAMLTAVTIGVNILVFSVLNSQLIEMRSSGAQTDETIKTLKAQNAAYTATERAFIYAGNAPLFFGRHIVDGNEMLATGTEWENSGNTQAETVVFQMSCGVSETEVYDPLKLDNIHIGKPQNAILGPHQKLTGGICFIGKGYIEDAKSGKYHIYLISVVKYFDIFSKNRHITERCIHVADLVGDPKDFSRPITFGGTACDTHNCADDQCKDN